MSDNYSPEAAIISAHSAFQKLADRGLLTKLDPEFKKRWIDALRSGNYTQGRYGLRDCDNKFCCLGVAAVVGNVPNQLGFAEQLYTFAFNDGADNNESVVPVGWNGLTSGVTGILINLNDTYHVPFSDIANLIEEYL